MAYRRVSSERLAFDPLGFLFDAELEVSTVGESQLAVEAGTQLASRVEHLLDERVVEVVSGESSESLFLAL